MQGCSAVAWIGLGPGASHPNQAGQPGTQQPFVKEDYFLKDAITGKYQQLALTLQLKNKV